MNEAYGYNTDGGVNEKEAANVRYIFQKVIEYNENPPQLLIDRARAEAEAHDIELTDEELLDRARLMIKAYIAEELNAMGE